VSKSKPPLCAAVHPVFALSPFGHVAAHPQIGTPTRAFRQLCMLTPSKGSASIERAHLCLDSREGEPPCRGTMPAAAFAEGRSPPAQCAVTDGEGGISSGRRCPCRGGQDTRTSWIRGNCGALSNTLRRAAVDFRRISCRIRALDRCAPSFAQGSARRMSRDGKSLSGKAGRGKGP